MRIWCFAPCGGTVILNSPDVFLFAGTPPGNGGVFVVFGRIPVRWIVPLFLVYPYHEMMVNMIYQERFSVFNSYTNILKLF